MKIAHAGFRFSPDKSIEGYATASRDGFDWHVEPALAGYTRLEHRNKSSNELIPVPICATPVVLPGVGVMVGGYDGTVRLFDTFLEKTYWTRQLTAPIYAPLLWLQDTSNVVVADTGGTVTCFSLKGDLVWARTLDNPVYPTMELLRGSGRIFVCCFDGVMMVLESDSGNIVAEVRLPRPWFANKAPRAGHRDPYASPIQIEADQVLVTVADTLAAFNGAGEMAWCHVGTAQFRASPTACHIRSTILAMSVDGSCSLLETGSGKQIAKFDVGEKVVASAATSGAVGAIGGTNGPTIGIDMSTGQRIWDRLHGAPFDHTGFSVLPNGSFICTNARGNVVARDSTDGRFLWETSQLIGLTGHSPRIDTTPICAPSGLMYAGSYDGALYAFVFKERVQ